ncbi:HlyD family secretion protein [Melioribacter sp. Ez-97]|uniref:HlyD family secretion protein n=1 Tax=Melioribacter sp. Ez-97 TaxID=3423434 RepID=UPI003EDADA2D
MIYRKKKYTSLAAVLITALVILLIINLVVTFDLRLQTIAKIAPYESLDVILYDNGELEARHYCFGKTPGLFSFVPERGDNIEITSLPVYSDKINSGDTLMSVCSDRLQHEIIKLEADLSNAVSELEVYKTGEKSQVIEAARNKIRLAEKIIERQLLQFHRADSLYKKDLISSDEYESYKYSLEQSKIQKAIYEYELRNLMTGTKKELIDFMKSKIRGLKNELENLIRSKNKLQLIAPFDGIVLYRFNSDTLFSVLNADTLILRAPVKVKDKDYLQTGKKYNIKLDDGNVISGKLLSAEPEIKYIENQNVIFCSFSFDNSNHKYSPGAIYPVELILGKTNLKEYLRRLFE